jgi:hypothetical protein
VFTLICLGAGVVTAVGYVFSAQISCQFAKTVPWIGKSDIENLAFIAGRFILLGGCLIAGAKLDFHYRGVDSGKINLLFVVAGLGAAALVASQTQSVLSCSVVLFVLALFQLAALMMQVFRTRR